MFVRFRQTPRRLQASVVETRRRAGKVASEHVASLGSIALPMTVRGRQAYWAYLWERLASLSDRISANDQARSGRRCMGAFRWCRPMGGARW
jgi:hypothetical protein